MLTRVFGRLTAWQNWIFNRPNAVGEQGRSRSTGPARKPNSTGKSLMSGINYSEIPNNVNLVNDRTLQRALEHWQPRFLDWWKNMGPSDFQAADVYLRTAISVDAQGWAHYGAVKMPEYRWGIFLADPVAGAQDRLRRPDGRSPRGSRSRASIARRCAGRHAGRHRARLGRAAAPARAHLPVAVRPEEPLPGERRGRPPPLGDGVPAARVLRPRRPRGGRGAARASLRRCRQAAHPHHVQRADLGLAVVLLLYLFHRPRRQVPAEEPRRARSIRCRAPAASCSPRKRTTCSSARPASVAW